MVIVDPAGQDDPEGCIGLNIMRGLRGDDYILGDDVFDGGEATDETHLQHLLNFLLPDALPVGRV